MSAVKAALRKRDMDINELQERLSGLEQTVIQTGTVQLAEKLEVLQGTWINIYSYSVSDCGGHCCTGEYKRLGCSYLGFATKGLSTQVVLQVKSRTCSVSLRRPWMKSRACSRLHKKGTRSTEKKRLECVSRYAQMPNHTAGCRFCFSEVAECSCRTSWFFSGKYCQCKLDLNGAWVLVF